MAETAMLTEILPGLLSGGLSRLLHLHGAWKKDVVLQMDVLMQITLEPWHDCSKPVS